MSADGAPRIDVPASATPEEAAALVAAVEQVLQDTAVAVEEAPKVSAWGRAARLEGVSRSAAWDTGGHELTNWG
jgi:hypothetical protein